MKIKFTLPTLSTILALSFMTSASAADGNLFDGNSNQSIVGGTEAPIGRYSHTVALSSSGFQFCGGSLIAPDTVLTAAHCMDGSSFDVVINRHDLRTTAGEVIPRRKAIKHPNYNGSTMANDFALVFLNSGTTQNVNFVKLNQDNSYPSAGSTSRAMGWGTTSSGGSTSNVLRQVDLPVISNQQCGQQYPQQTIFANNICTFLPGKDTCQGDSGGPLIMPGANAAADVLIGLTSWGYGCASQQYPGVYARVSNQIEWIKTNVCKESSFPPADLCGSNGTPSPTKKPSPSPTKKPVVGGTPSPTKKPTSKSPTSSEAAVFTKMNTAGYCLDAAGEWYAAFKSDALPLSSTDDAYCLNWCSALQRSDLVAVEIYRDWDAYCYCDFPGGSVPNDLSLSSFDPPADEVVNYLGDGAVTSTDSVQGAVCYKNDNFQQSKKPTNSPSRKPTLPPTMKPTPVPTATPTRNPSKAPVTSKPTTAPSKKPTAFPTATPTDSPSSASPTSLSPITASPVSPPSGGDPQDAIFDSGFAVPRCKSTGSSCSTGDLLDGRSTISGGPEPGQPNTLDGCADGQSGTYHSDESVDKIFVRSGETDGTGSGVNLEEGGRATIIASVWAWGSGASDTADFFYAADASSPNWQYIGSVTPATGGAQDLMVSYDLPQGTDQAVRVQFRYAGSIGTCTSGSYNDRDDVVFAVAKGTSQPTQSPVKTQLPTEPAGGGPQQASYDASLSTARCSVYGSECDSLGFLNGRGTMRLGNEPNQPNTLDTCTDGNSGSYHFDESVDRIVVRSGEEDGTGSGVTMVEGGRATIIATVWPWYSGSSDYADFYYASNSANAQWVYIGTKKPSGSGLQEIKMSYTLPQGINQAVRVNFRYRGVQGANGACSKGSYDDNDDLVFAVKSNPSFTGLVKTAVAEEEPKDISEDAAKRNELTANTGERGGGSKAAKNAKRA